MNTLENRLALNLSDASSGAVSTGLYGSWRLEITEESLAQLSMVFGLPVTRAAIREQAINFWRSRAEHCADENRHHWSVYDALVRNNHPLWAYLTAVKADKPENETRASAAYEMAKKLQLKEVFEQVIAVYYGS